MAVNNVPFTIYTVKNESTKGVNIYLGVASLSNNVTTVDYFPHRVIACKTTYLFASIVGSRNVRITRPTTVDPYIYVETRKVIPTKVGEYDATSFMKSGDSKEIVLRTITSDKSIKIEDYGCNYGLSTFKYEVANACNINGFLYKTVGIPGHSNVTWHFKNINASSYIMKIRSSSISFGTPP